MAAELDDSTLRRYLDDDLPFEERERIERHLRSSPECARRLLKLGHMQIQQTQGSDDGYGLPRRFGRYDVNRLVACGGKAFVYEARDMGTQQHIALKILRPEAIEEHHSVIRFRREADLMTRIEHPNIVRIVEAGEQLDHLFIAMEFISGPNLHQFVRRRARVQLKTTLTVACQVARALGAAHDRGIIHRDVKPSNVLVETTGIVKVSDFGLARLIYDEASAISRARRLIGSPVCIPPEQIQSRRTDARADVYGVGCLLFFMATGRFPFSGDRIQMVRAHLVQKPPRPSDVASDLPTWFDQLVLRCLEKDPEKRWRDMQELFTILNGYRVQVAGAQAE